MFGFHVWAPGYRYCVRRYDCVGAILRQGVNEGAAAGLRQYDRRRRPTAWARAYSARAISTTPARMMLAPSNRGRSGPSRSHRLPTNAEMMIDDSRPATT